MAEFRMLQKVPRFNPKEIEVIGWIGLGREDADIAERMEITETEVQTHLRNIYNLLGAGQDRLNISLFAIYHGITPLKLVPSPKAVAL